MIKIAVFASGRGSNFQMIHQKICEGYISAKVVLLITDNRQAGAITFAREHHIPASLVKPGDFPSPEAFGRQLLRLLEQHQIDFIVLAGYLKKIPPNVVEKYRNRILNIHPALLPAFGGKGMYGSRVHEAVFQSGAKISGVTVHLVNNDYDAGPIVLQKAVAIDDCNTPQEIATKVLKEEHRAFPEALKLLIENEVTIEGQRVRIRNPKHALH